MEQMGKTISFHAAYNRKDLTLACLRSRARQPIEGVALDTFVLDDASTDRTGAALGKVTDNVPRKVRKGPHGAKRREQPVDAVRFLADVIERQDGACGRLRAATRGHSADEGQISSDQRPLGFARAHDAGASLYQRHDSMADRSLSIIPCLTLDVVGRKKAT